MEFKRPELVIPGVALLLIGVVVAFGALSTLELGLGVENSRLQYLLGTAAIFAGVYMLDRVYGFVGR